MKHRDMMRELFRGTSLRWSHFLVFHDLPLILESGVGLK